MKFKFNPPFHILSLSLAVNGLMGVAFLLCAFASGSEAQQDRMAAHAMIPFGGFTATVACFILRDDRNEY